MKKIYMILAAASVMLAASCNKEEAPVNNTPREPMVVNFTAQVADTKTAFNPASYENGAAVPVLWEAGDALDIYVNEKALTSLVKEIEVVPSDDKTTATWDCDFASVYDGTAFGGYVPEAPYTFYAFCPGENTRAFYNAGKSRILVDAIPAEQNPSENTCDKTAMMTCSVSATYDTWPTEVAMPEFTHMTAYGCITLGSGIPAEATVSKVTVTANEGQYLAGTGWYYYAGENKGTWEDYNTTSSTETITINTTSKENIWFSCRPTTDLTTLTFVVTTDAGDYQVSKTLSGKNFTAGKIAKMTINGFEAVGAVEPEPEPTNVTYTYSQSTLVPFFAGTYDGSTEMVNTSEENPKLNWSATAVLSSNVESVKVAAAATDSGTTRVKFNAGIDKFTFTITPDAGWMIQNVTINSKTSSTTNNYSIIAKIGDVELINVASLTKTDTDYSNDVENNEEGALIVTIEKTAETSAAFYMKDLVLTLKKTTNE